MKTVRIKPSTYALVQDVARKNGLSVVDAVDQMLLRVAGDQVWAPTPTDPTGEVASRILARLARHPHTGTELRGIGDAITRRAALARLVGDGTVVAWSAPSYSGDGATRGRDVTRYRLATDAEIEARKVAVP